jgi:hypothetical protein
MSVAVWIFILPSTKKIVNNKSTISGSTNKQQNADVKNESSDQNKIIQQPKNLEKAHAVSESTLDLSKLFVSSSNENQVFKVQAGNIATVTGRQGVRLVINPFDLVTSDGKPVNGDITVTLREYTDKIAMLEANVQTVSDGKLLESGGAYYIELMSNNSVLQLMEGRSMEAYFPAINQPGMELFSGSRNQQGDMNWIRLFENSAGLIDQAEIVPPQRKFYSSPDWKFRTFQILITSSEMNFYAEGTRGIKITSWQYEMNDQVRKIIKDQISRAKFSPRSYWNFGNMAGYYFFTDNCEIMLEADAYKKGIAPISSEELCMLKEKVDCYFEERNQKIASSSSLVSEAGLPRLGWINCDRFYTDTSVKKDLLVTLDYPEKTSGSSTAVFMVFKNINSVIDGFSISNSSYSFTKIPSNQEVCIIALSRSGKKILAGKSSNFKLADLEKCQIKLNEINEKQLAPLINSL